MTATYRSAPQLATTHSKTADSHSVKPPARASVADSRSFGLIAAGLILAVGFQSGCASAPFKVISEPIQANLFVVDSASGEKRLLGQTPFEMPKPEFQEKVGSSAVEGQFVSLVVEKDGFLPETVSVPMSGFGVLVTEVRMKLKEGTKEAEAKLAKDVLDRLFLAQRFALSQQFERAHIEIDKILSSFPNFPRALSMRGSIYMAQQNYAESIKWFDRALTADPQMEETVRLAARVRVLAGGAAPSAAGDGRSPAATARPGAVPAALPTTPRSQAPTGQGGR